MSTYRYRSSTYRSKRNYKRITFVTCGIAITLLILSFIIGASLIKQRHSNKVVESSGKTSEVAAEVVKVFRTKYFQFQTNSSWFEISSENENKFSYRSMRGPLVQQDITIYINVDPVLSDVTRVQPIDVIDGSRLNTKGPISDHCRVILPPGADKVLTKITMGGVSFTCRADGTLFIVLVADTKGLPSFRLTRPDRTSAQYTIIYRDLTTYPAGRDLEGIIKSFQAL